MSEAAPAVLPGPCGPNVPAPMSALGVSAHLMTLETGLFCIVQSRAAAPPDGSGLPAVRVSPPPGGHDGVAISSFRADGWLGGQDEAALVRITEGPAQILVTIYQSPARDGKAAPKLQVLRLTPEREPQAAENRPGPPPPDAASPRFDVLAHVQGRGDVLGRFGEWIGTPGSRLAIEGFGLSPGDALTAGEIEYQAILGRSWASPWVEGGAFCGSRGMALPLLGLRVRLRGRAAEALACGYAATFVDGSSAGPVAAGEACHSPSLAPLEALRITLTPRASPAILPAS